MISNHRITLRPAVGPQDHSLGSSRARVTLVEYGDYECPFCARAHPIVTSIRAQLGDGLRFVFRNFPLSSLHRHALHAAEAAESVGSHAGADAYWTMHDSLFVHQRDGAFALDDEHLAEYAAGAGADPGVIRNDLRAATYQNRVASDFAGGVGSGVNGTPTFFINAARFDGDWTEVASFVEALRSASADESLATSRRVHGT
jgi:protein-disulfide isomerase